VSTQGLGDKIHPTNYPGAKAKSYIITTVQFLYLLPNGVLPG